MRQKTINQTTTVYPNGTVWEGDNNTVTVSNPNYTVGASITLTNTTTQESRQLIYVSELKNLTFSLNDTIRRLFTVGGCTVNASVTLYVNGFTEGYFGFNMKVLDGKTLPHRSHGSTRTVYVYGDEDLASVQFVFAGAGTLTVGGTQLPVGGAGRRAFNLLPYVRTSGEHWACYRYGNSPFDKDTTTAVEIVGVKSLATSGVLALNFSDISMQPVTDEIKGGGVWNDSEVNLADYCIRIVREEPCDGFDFFKLKYYDTDGCLRYLGGRIMSEDTSAGGTNYTNVPNSVYRDLSRKHLTEANGTVKVAFGDLRRDSYYSDIFLAENVWFRNYGGEWIPCSLETSKTAVKSEEYSDLELEISLYKF